MNIGETITVPYEEAKALRKQGWKPRNDIVVMMFVGVPAEPRTNRGRAIHAYDPEKLSQAPSAIRMRRSRANRAAAL